MPKMMRPDVIFYQINNIIFVEIFVYKFINKCNIQFNGEVAEWSKAPVLKTGERASVPWVRIPPSPPFFI